jgi:hypothetical protein
MNLAMLKCGKIRKDDRHRHGGGIEEEVYECG